MNIEFQTAGDFFYGPGSSGLGASMNKLFLCVKDYTHEVFMGVILGSKITKLGL